jgi:hypothetical protein
MACIAGHAFHAALLFSPQESISREPKLREGVYMQVSLCYQIVVRILGLEFDTIVECWESTLV